MNLSAPSDQERVVLLVDDMPASLDFLVQALDRAGYTVLVADSGERALRLLELGVPDAILLDAAMPGMDGFATCRRIKAVDAYAHVPVIFMTGLAETEHVLAGFDAGGVDYVVKPVRIPEVLARLATHARNARIARLAREAVDIGGHGVVLVDSHGRIAWQSPQAARWLGEAFAEQNGHPPADWLLALCTASLPGGGETLALRDGRSLNLSPLGPAGLGESLLLLSPRQPGGSPSGRLALATLTRRETEVLSWIAKGKTNRDIGEILGMSPRTVNKHLEHVFEKLGVETRAAAAALATRGLDPAE
ncbi:response regulator transcription factor [Pseudothauera rhizosphaerae]|uniref:Response regulator transcription factor n=1 Tax=Pseudothauera rhizosphaerae TaxID=2565932 RepID=A0A4S4AJ55_9RHOO|nr:DNA-binding response regulator [Pseudothauera rhizosphaerae]THF59425.1 response regulator transcription factor [Pseudothauera rhizosphaerae]